MLIFIVGALALAAIYLAVLCTLELKEIRQSLEVLHSAFENQVDWAQSVSSRVSRMELTDALNDKPLIANTAKKAAKKVSNKKKKAVKA